MDVLDICKHITYARPDEYTTTPSDNETTTVDQAWKDDLYACKDSASSREGLRYEHYSVSSATVHNGHVHFCSGTQMTRDGEGPECRPHLDATPARDMQSSPHTGGKEPYNGCTDLDIHDTRATPLESMSTDRFDAPGSNTSQKAQPPIAVAPEAEGATQSHPAKQDQLRAKRSSCHEP